MACQACMRNGKRGWQAGSSGRCHTGPGARAKCERENQMRMRRALDPLILMGGPGIDIPDSGPPVDEGEITLVGFARAHTPAHMSSDLGTHLIISGIPGVVSGDLILAGWYFNTNQPTISSPSTMSDLWQLNNSSRIQFRYSDGNEPAEYAWSGGINIDKAGVMVAYRNAKLGAFAAQYERITDDMHGLLSPDYSGAALAGFYIRNDSVDLFTAATPSGEGGIDLVEWHRSAAVNAAESAAFQELNVTPNVTLSGRDMDSAGASEVNDVRPCPIILHRSDQWPRAYPDPGASSTAHSPALGSVAGNTVVISGCADVAEGKLMIAVIAIAATTAPTGPSGWVRYGFSQNCSVWAKVATDADTPTTTYTWTHATSNLARTGCMLTISGGQLPADPATAGSTIGTVVALGAASTSVTTTPVAAIPGMLMVTFCTHIEALGTADIAATGTGHTLQVQSVGGAAGVFRSCAIATTEISTYDSAFSRTFTDPESSGWRAGYLTIHPL